jgi:plastocyanin
MHRRKVALIAALASVVTIVAVSATSASGRTSPPRTHDTVNVIDAKGVEDFDPNGLIYSTFRFDPGTTKAHTGEHVRFRDTDRSPNAPHSLTIVRFRDVPTTFDDVLFGCEACNEAIGAHFATDPPTLKVDVGQPGLDTAGDSLLILPGQSISSVVSAEANRTLWFVCAFHPWMQGRIVVG